MLSGNIIGTAIKVSYTREAGSCQEAEVRGPPRKRKPLCQWRRESEAIHRRLNCNNHDLLCRSLVANQTAAASVANDSAARAQRRGFRPFRCGSFGPQVISDGRRKQCCGGV